MEHQSNNNRYSISQQRNLPTNCILDGDCSQVMRQLSTGSIDFIRTDPLYLVNYCDHDGRSIQNGGNPDWLNPVFAEAYRVLKTNSFIVALYSWTKVDLRVTISRSIKHFKNIGCHRGVQFMLHPSVTPRPRSNPSLVRGQYSCCRRHRTYCHEPRLCSR